VLSITLSCKRGGDHIRGLFERSEFRSARTARVARRVSTAIADDSDAGCLFSFPPFSLGKQRERGSPSKGETIATSTYDNEHFALPSATSSRSGPLLQVGQHPSPSALPSTAGGVRELREDCLSEASSAAPAQFASRAGDRRRQPTTVMRGVLSLSPFLFGQAKRKGVAQQGETIGTSAYDNEHFALRSGNFIAVKTAPSSARSVAVRPAPTARATPSPSALPSTTGGVRELREDCLSEASSAAPAQLASRAGDRRR
jgi:hypothetical protein